MKKTLLLLLLSCSLITQAQRNVVYKDSFELKSDFIEQVKKGMNKHHKSFHGNSFYNYNVNKNPVSTSEDSITYNVKFIAASRLWGGHSKFYKSDNRIVCEISNLILLKKTSMNGVDYINVSVNEMEDTKGNKINLYLLQDEIKDFFKKFK